MQLFYCPSVRAQTLGADSHRNCDCQLSLRSSQKPISVHPLLSLPSTTQLLTQVLTALVFIDVNIDFFDSKDSSRQRCLVRVSLGGGTQQLHQQQRVPHHPLHWLDEEGAQVNVVCAAPGKLGQRRCTRLQSSSATPILPSQISASQTQNTNAAKSTILLKSSHCHIQAHCTPECLVL